MKNNDRHIINTRNKNKMVVIDSRLHKVRNSWAMHTLV